MAWANLQKPATAGGVVLGGTTITQTFAALTNGSRIVVMVACWKAAAVTCTGVADTVNTYAKDVDLVDVGSGVHISIWSAPNTSTSALTVTGTISNTGADASICITEWSGLSTAAGASARDGTASVHVANATSVSTTPAVTTSAANELAFSGLAGNGDNRLFTIGAGFTAGQNNTPDPAQDVATEYKDTGASSSSITGDWTIASGFGNNSALLVVYKLAAAGAPLIRPEQPVIDQAVNRAATY